MSAAEFFAHPDYSSTTIKNDIGLVRLPKPIEFSGETELLPPS
jgi:hypothetical protein